MTASGASWRLVAWVVAGGVLLPVVSLVLMAASADAGQWTHLRQHVLPDAIGDTAVLLAGVGLAVVAIGAGCAWLVETCDFPARRTLSWALLLPLAMPTYITAFAYLDLLHPLGPVQGAIRWLLGIDSPRGLRLPDLRSMGGAMFVLASVLYPYVYLTMRAMFASQPAHLLEAARALGETRFGAFRHVAWPMARPALAAGVSLALLEALNDIGASEFLGVRTLTVTIYTTWVTRSDLAGAAQIACAMLVAALALIALEQHSRRRHRYAATERMQAAPLRRLAGPWRWLVTLTLLMPVLLGFVAPTAHLIGESIKRWRQGSPPSAELWSSLFNTLGVSAGVTLVAVSGAMLLLWIGRSFGAATSWRPARWASIGYAIPGTVLAVGLLTPALTVDAAIAERLGVEGLPLMRLGVVLVVACTIRFLAMPIGSIESAYARIPIALDHAARSLGETAAGTWRRIQWPLLRPAIAAGALLVFVDTMKELPATLMLRPANFETLATRLYGEAARGSYEEGALAALAIVLAGLLPIVLLARARSGESRRTTA